MNATKNAAIAATLANETLLSRIRDVVGSDIGDPLNVDYDSAALRDRFDLTIEYTHNSTFAFNDDGLCAALKTCFPDSRSSARRAACIAVASMWTPAIGMAARRRQKAAVSDVPVQKTGGE